MEKYIFNKDYETQVRTSVVGGTGTGTRQIKIAKDTIVDGEEVSKGLTSIQHEGNNISIDSSYLDLYSAPRSIHETPKSTVKGEVKAKIDSIKKESQNIFTTKNVVIISLVLGAALVVLRYKKII